MTTLSSLFAKNNHSEKGFVPLFYPITDYEFEWHHVAKDLPYVIPTPKEMHRGVAGIREDHYDTVNGKFLTWAGREGANQITKATFNKHKKEIPQRRFKCSFDVKYAIDSFCEYTRGDYQTEETKTLLATKAVSHFLKKYGNEEGLKLCNIHFKTAGEYAYFSNEKNKLERGIQTGLRGITKSKYYDSLRTTSDTAKELSVLEEKLNVKSYIILNIAILSYLVSENVLGCEDYIHIEKSYSECLDMYLEDMKWLQEQLL